MEIEKKPKLTYPNEEPIRPINVTNSPATADQINCWGGAEVYAGEYYEDLEAILQQAVNTGIKGRRL